LVFSNVSAQYTRAGNLVFAYGTVTYPTTANATGAVIAGLPVLVPNAQYARQGVLTFSSSSNATYVMPNANSSSFGVYNASGVQANNAQLSGAQLFFLLIYPTS
jgi:hypothetical protein